jgi:sec-independent protein translocase protein TatA
MFGELGVPELLFIFVIALLIFGPKKLGELGKGLGEGIRHFKSALSAPPEVAEKAPVLEAAEKQ